MSRKNKIKIGCMVMFFSILISIIVGRCTAKSYINNVILEDYLSNSNLKVEYCDMGYDYDTNKGFIDGNKIEDIQDLESGSDIIVKVKLNENYIRQIYGECILSQVEIEEVYKGDLKIGEKLNVFEPDACVLKDCMLATDGYSMMQDDCEYILFLKTLPNTFFGKGDFVYAPSSTTYSKYLCKDVNPRLFQSEELEEPETMLKYSNIKEEEVYLCDEEQYQKYLSLKNQVLDKYN
jgi:hypothetical protein